MWVITTEFLLIAVQKKNIFNKIDVKDFIQLIVLRIKVIY